MWHRHSEGSGRGIASLRPASPKTRPRACEKQTIKQLNVELKNKPSQSCLHFWTASSDLSWVTWIQLLLLVLSETYRNWHCLGHFFPQKKYPWDANWPLPITWIDKTLACTGFCYNTGSAPGSIMAFKCGDLGKQNLRSLDGLPFNNLPVTEQWQWKIVTLNIDIHCHCCCLH